MKVTTNSVIFATLACLAVCYSASADQDDILLRNDQLCIEIYSKKEICSRLEMEFLGEPEQAKEVKLLAMRACNKARKLDNERLDMLEKKALTQYSTCSFMTITEGEVGGQHVANKMIKRIKKGNLGGKLLNFFA